MDSVNTPKITSASIAINLLTNMNLFNSVQTTPPHRILSILMKDNVVRFKYKKVDGSIRTAIGTQTYMCIVDNGGEIPNTIQRVKKDGTVAKISPDVIRYWDVDKGGWRSCRKDSVIEVVDYMVYDGAVNMDYVNGKIEGIKVQ